jgi:hypothetical protein
MSKSFAQGKKHKKQSLAKAEVKATGRVEMCARCSDLRCRVHAQPPTASHTHIHDPDTHGDQSRSLIIQPPNRIEHIEHNFAHPGPVAKVRARLSWSGADSKATDHHRIIMA